MVDIYQYDNHVNIAPGIIRHVEGQPPSKQEWTLVPQMPPTIPEIVEIQEFILTKLSVGPWDLMQWIIVGRRGATLSRHNHMAHMAAVYHVEGEGDLVVEDDNGGGRLVPVVPGQLTMWPAELVHSVTEVTTDRRISVGFQIMKTL